MTNQIKDKGTIEKAKNIVSIFAEVNNFKDYSPLKKIILKITGHKVDTTDSLEDVVYSKIYDYEGNMILGLGWLFADKIKKFRDPENFSDLENSILGFYEGLRDKAIPDILFAANKDYMRGYESGKKYEKKQELFNELNSVGYSH